MASTSSDPSHSTARALAIAVFVAAIAFAVVPFFANPFSGFEPGRFPEPVDNPPIQPAGWAFSIWGVIYLWLIAGTGFGLLKRADAPAWEPHRPWALVSLVVGAAWIPIANASPVWATILILVMLVTAVMAMVKLPRTDVAWGRWPFGLYAGWLTAASFVSLATLAAGYGVMTAALASWIALPAALIVAAFVTLRHGTPTYPAAAAWGAFGIAVVNWPTLYAMTAAAGALLLLVLAVRALARR
ncbi:tryptophan-rich sensory protein [Gymnodinialimonas ceratoperidinii]|uniref:TspO/MBR related protein n=1 Tax=Gymnodinialimonas ceratoperidinii TaxID=2856823 RepID=A0A8F6TWJ4_9RHOB|nr:tryptophan-rich sensory protein [Gymnodinialimonas ceratoperidinii]QXT39243.1 hypothetical protein KYE46_15150 [Gymnodinialimonas ceratoperidinii]